MPVSMIINTIITDSTPQGSTITTTVQSSPIKKQISKVKSVPSHTQNKLPKLNMLTRLAKAMKEKVMKRPIEKLPIEKLPIEEQPKKIQRLVSEPDSESESETEFEAEFEAEFEMKPIKLPSNYKPTRSKDVIKVLTHLSLKQLKLVNERGFMVLDGDLHEKEVKSCWFALRKQHNLIKRVKPKSKFNFKVEPESEPKPESEPMSKS